MTKDILPKLKVTKLAHFNGFGNIREINMNVNLDYT